MGLSINQNIAAVNSYRNLSNTQNDLSKSLEKLSSGFRINRAADDAAGLAISEGLRSQVGGLKVAARNAQDGISVVQTAEGALTETHAILQRVRDLAVQAGNDSNNAEARKNIDTEATQLVSELDRISKSTNFNGTNLLDGTAGGGSGKLQFQVGADGDANSQITVDLSGANIKAIAADLSTGSLAVGGTEFTVSTAALTASAYTFSVDNGSGVTSDIAVTLATAPTSVQGLADALAADTNFNANFSVNVIKDANGAATGISVKALNGGDVAVVDPGAGIDGGNQVANTQQGLDFSSAAAAQASITKIDEKISSVSTARANLGALQNRFEHTVKNINVSVENLSASESRIRDTDMASEMVNFTRAQILSQAGTSMLAQANQIPQGVLSLLR
ncbi:flagellin/flagellar hook associated protein [Sanguibacter keddieii DSM 10542]|uniref:Flagellin n=1 Tax=Sanguibacter keddieii (strain ATCC 51767 / DSM 10542 / NCFB 3025 / ST-74) TaxID=446469 RepID=D1BD22_SANKS|nr:flagellin [Sanguibacter keddieii]ACZ23026.1 flagellin/flagellar hook associated protein [Sanguibacter keddieii DSM 10542]